MKHLTFIILAVFAAFVFFPACEDDNTTPSEQDTIPNNTDDNDTTNPNTDIEGNWEGNWFFDFDGTIDGGDAYDVIKSSVDNKIYICGAFLHVNNNWDLKNLTRWNPSTNSWEQVPGIDEYHSNFIRCVVEDDDGNLYFGGDFSSIGGVTAGKVGKFNVSSESWSNLRDPNYYVLEDEYGPSSGGVYSIAYMNDYVYIGGYTFNSDSAALRYIRRYDTNNGTWEGVGAGVNGKVSAMVCDGNGNLYVGGSFTEAGGSPVNYIAKWDGSSWTALGDGMDNFVLSLAYDNGNLYAGGSFRNVDGSIVSQGIAKWDGSSWEAMSKGVYASWGSTYSVQDVCVDSDGKVYISGGFDKNYNTDEDLNHVGVFEEGAWKSLGAGLATTSSQVVLGSYADDKDIYFVGYFSKGDGDPNTKYNTAVWNETMSE